MNLKISTVSSKTQTLKETAAAVFVITQEDIRRSSANSIPELLRMAPGLFVARIDGNKWSVTSRGYSGRFADDLLVMVDGRTVYSPLFAGTFWETLDLPLEDIERIEVIRGPSGTIWGANAANGAIHIITKHARMTQGNLITSGGGSEERGFATLRHGGKIGESFFYRLFTKGFARDNSFSPSGANDSWRMGTVGFRADWDINANNAITFQGQYYGGKAGQNRVLINPNDADILIRYTRNIAEISACQAVFIAKSEIGNLNQIGTKPILTVTDSSDAIPQGIVINMTLKEGKVVFDADIKAAQEKNFNSTLNYSVLPIRYIDDEETGNC